MTDSLSAIFSALADPTRRTILSRLTSGEATVTQIAEPLEISLPAVSRHLKVLENAGLVTRTRSAQWRPCRLRADPIQEVVEWAAEFRKFWDASYDQLDDYLDQLKGKPGHE